MTDPASVGFDASVEFAPFNGLTMAAKGRTRSGHPRMWTRIAGRVFRQHAIFDYGEVARSMWECPDPHYRRFHCVSPGWDNSARRKVGATILADSEPTIYGQWLRTVAERTRRTLSPGQQIIFINAWNEWAEGNHLEPDLRWGERYLRETQQAIT